MKNASRYSGFRPDARRMAEPAERYPHLRHHGGFGHGFGGPGFPGFPFDGPRGPRGRGRAGRGDIRAAILSLLGDGPTNGYGIIKSVAEKTEGTWRPSPGSVYPTLQQLVDEELIQATRPEESAQGRRTEYELTDAGRAHAAEHEDELNRAWEQNPAPPASSRELFEAIGKLMGVVGQFRHGATDEQRAAATAKIDETRKALYLILAE